MRKLLALLLFANPLFAQQQVQPVAGVLTLNLIPGTSSFKVILSANVTSVVIQNPTPGTIISIIFTENATGGFSVVFGGNIANPCAVATSASTTTTCQFQYDASSNTWNGIGGGGSGPAAFGASGIQLTATKYNAALDAGFANDAVFNSTNVITSATAHFQTRLKPAKAGQVVWGLSDVNGLSGIIILAVGTISSVDSDSQIHTSTTATATQTGLLFWGTDDSTPIANFWTDVKTTNNGQTCGVLPSGIAIVSQSEFTDTSTTRLYADCLYSTGFFTVIVSPSMNWATCPTVSSGCFWYHPTQIAVQQPNSDYVANIEVWGGGYNWATLGSSNTIMTFQRTTVSNVWVWGIGSNTGSGLIGMTFSGPVQIFESVVYQVDIACSTSNGGGNGTVALYASFCGGTGTNLNVAAGAVLDSLGSQYGPTINGGTGVGVAGRLNSYGDVFLGTGGFTVTINSGGVLSLNASEVDMTGSGGTALLIQAGGTVVSTGATRLNASGGGGANAILQQTTGTFRSGGNEIITGVTNIAPTCAMTTGGGTGPACALVAGSTNEKGTVRMTPGTTPGATGTTTLTFAGTFTGSTGATPSCNFSYANTGTGAWSLTTTTPIVMTTRSSTAPVFNWNQTGALTAASTYDIDYVCVPR